MEKSINTKLITRYGDGSNGTDYRSPQLRQSTSIQVQPNNKIRLEENLLLVDGKYPLTDVGNAENFASQHNENIRYCSEMNSFIYYDGKRWKRDSGIAAYRLAKETARSILGSAAGCLNDEKRKRLIQWAIKSENKARINAMLKLARHEDRIPICSDELDQDKFLLNVNNGTINLRTGELYQHQRRDMITKLAEVEYRSDAQCPYWLHLLDTYFQRDQDMIEYSQRVVGYSLTGSTDEHAFFILCGDGSNGKSTFVQTISNLLGDYAHNTTQETLLAKSGDSIPSDVAALKGKRFVYASETDNDRRFAVARIKALTGGDMVSARFLYNDFFSFIPECKIFLGTNNIPRIGEMSHAIWRRIKLIPFNYRISVDEQRPRREIDEKLNMEMPGILRWAVDGCLKWQHNGLNEPEAVRAATNKYRSTEDIVGTFLGECCIQKQGARTENASMREAFSAFCKEYGMHRVSLQEFKSAMEREGIHQKNSGGRYWDGVQLSRESLRIK
jgi:putative DNA primase/helicase